MPRRMRNHKEEDRGKVDPIVKLTSIEGIEEAIEVVKCHALHCAWTQTYEMAHGGELGEEVQKLYANGSDEAMEESDKADIVDSCMGDTYDEWLEYLAISAGPRIAELWGLSEGAGSLLSDHIYWGFALKDDVLQLRFLISPTDQHMVDTLCDRGGELRASGVVALSPEALKDGHMYLDVTYLTDKHLRTAYRSIRNLRRRLGLKAEDLREGSHARMDSAKALRCVQLRKEGKSHTEIAKELGFQVYDTDSDSSVAPQVRKYIDRGRAIQEKLDQLDLFLDELQP
jgi:hypothetical protein